MSISTDPQDKIWCLPPLEAFYLTGPTASGKTPLALEVAQRLNAEIISMDSMAIYKGMDIGTAKPTRQDQQLVPHHMLDIVAPTESYSVSCYVDTVHRLATEIRHRGKLPMFVGGTPLYLKSLLRGMFSGPPADEEFRKAVEADTEEYGIDSLRDRLRQVDPLLAHKLHPHDQRRMIRALEVARVTGKPLSHWQTQFETPSANPKIRAVVIGIDRAWLHERIDHRVQKMIQSGLEQEVKDLVNEYGQLGSTASQAVGYREFIERFEKKISLEQTTAEILAHTRQFARRQEIWFRGLPELHRIVLEPNTQLTDLAQQVSQWFTQEG